MSLPGPNDDAVGSEPKRQAESHRLWAVAVVLAALVGALVSGPHRAGALVGAALSGAAGLLSIQAMSSRAGAGRPIQQALLVMVVGFLARIVLVSVGTIAIVKTGESVPGFVVAFFVVFFALAGIEGAYVQRLGRRTGSSA